MHPHVFTNMQYSHWPTKTCFLFNLSSLVNQYKYMYLVLQNKIHRSHVHTHTHTHTCTHSHTYTTPDQSNWCHLILSECSLMLSLQSVCVWHSWLFAQKGVRRQRMCCPPTLSVTGTKVIIWLAHTLTLVKVRWLGKGKCPKGAACH